MLKGEPGASPPEDSGGSASCATEKPAHTPTRRRISTGFHIADFMIYPLFSLAINTTTQRVLIHNTPVFFICQEKKWSACGKARPMHC
jgi:hypothetical protein